MAVLKVRLDIEFTFTLDSNESIEIDMRKILETAYRFYITCRRKTTTT